MLIKKDKKAANPLLGIRKTHNITEEIIRE